MAAAALQLDHDWKDELLRALGAKAKLQKRVLLIEDNEEAMYLVQYAFDEFGNGEFQLEWASTLIAGLEALSHGGIDVILLDLGLPESSGPESYAWVREIAPTTPAIVLTGDSSEETEFAVTASGAEGYLMKDLASGAFIIKSIRAALYANKLRKEACHISNRMLRPRFRDE